MKGEAPFGIGNGTIGRSFLHDIRTDNRQSFFVVNDTGNRLCILLAYKSIQTPPGCHFDQHLAIYDLILISGIPENLCKHLFQRNIFRFYAHFPVYIYMVIIEKECKLTVFFNLFQNLNYTTVLFVYWDFVILRVGRSRNTTGYSQWK